jgi:hypothetical protein
MPIRGKAIGILFGALGTMEPRCPMGMVAQPDPVTCWPTALPPTPEVASKGPFKHPDFSLTVVRRVAYLVV